MANRRNIYSFLHSFRIYLSLLVSFVFLQLPLGRQLALVLIEEGRAEVLADKLRLRLQVGVLLVLMFGGSGGLGVTVGGGGGGATMDREAVSG